MSAKRLLLTVATSLALVALSGQPAECAFCSKIECFDGDTCGKECSCIRPNPPAPGYCAEIDGGSR